MTVPVIHLAATLFMVGVIVFVQVVHYPLMAQVGNTMYRGYQEAHMRRTTWVVFPGMTVELGTAIALISGAFGTGASVPALVGLALLGVIWLSTALVQVPLHRRLVRSFDPAAHRRLVQSNWIRTLAWAARVPVAVALL